MKNITKAAARLPAKQRMYLIASTCPLRLTMKVFLIQDNVIYKQDIFLADGRAIRVGDGNNGPISRTDPKGISAFKDIP